jgi:hypothetical protein
MSIYDVSLFLRLRKRALNSRMVWKHQYRRRRSPKDQTLHVIQSIYTRHLLQKAEWRRKRLYMKFRVT